MNFGVVVLNYMAHEATIACVDSFIRQSSYGHRVFIVIVDNASPNESFEVLNSRYRSHPIVSVVQTKENLGFANGNNFGLCEIRKRFEPDYVIFSNDDIVLIEDGLYKWILECDEMYHFAVLGPRIYSTKGDYSQNPLPDYVTNIDQCRREIRKYRVFLAKLCIKKALRMQSNYPALARWENNADQEPTDKMTLHGSFQVFSAGYFSAYTEAYDPRTFLYGEEYILRLRCNAKGLKMVYSPGYRVNHMQAVSTEMMNKSSFGRAFFRTKHIIRFLKIYINILENMR